MEVNYSRDAHPYLFFCLILSKTTLNCYQFLFHLNRTKIKKEDSEKRRLKYE
jgi:hypothetical protein